MKWKIGLGLLLISLIVAWRFGDIVEAMISPSVLFDASLAPPAPEYGQDASWSALPERSDYADRAPPGVSASDPQHADADVFFVHATSYVGRNWNARIDDASLNAATDVVTTGIQASAFNGCCRVYAPRYRQATGTAFYRSSPDGDRAIALAYEDVKAAFAAFNARRGTGRPFILAGHSQGSVMAERLLYEVISGSPLREQLVAAYLIGGRVTVAGLRAHAPDLPVCSAANDLHCVAAWNARGPNYVPTRYEMHRSDASERVCTNPLTWRTDDAFAAAALNQGAVFLNTANPAPRSGFADARCVNGVLIVDQIGRPPRDLASQVLDRLMGAENYHAIEYQLFFMNLWHNAQERVAEFRAR